MRLKYKFNDGGRKAAGFSGSAGDCVVRAVAIATEQDYQKVYDELSVGCKEQRLTKRSRVKSSARNGVNVQRKWFKDYMAKLGWGFTATMGIGTGCRVHLNSEELPQGRLIVSVSKHYTTVIDGVIHDTFDPSERGCTIYPAGSGSLPAETPEPERPDHVPAGARWLANGNGWAYSPERCVYGYWSKKE